MRTNSVNVRSLLENKTAVYFSTVLLIKREREREHCGVKLAGHRILYM